MRSVIFDLDDTLYPEIEFVKSGFRAVANFLATQLGVAPEQAFRRMMFLLRDSGRDKIFQKLLGYFQERSQPLAAEMLWVYRTHLPTIEPYDGVGKLLDQLTQQEYRLGLITDGKAAVQHRKIDALGIRHWFQCVIATDDVGSRFIKPNQAAYTLALKVLQSAPSESTYVADDLRKDFVIPNRLGMGSIQVRLPNQGLAAGVVAESDNYRARTVVDSLDDILACVTRRSAA